MKACEVHENGIVVFNGDDCPLCQAEKTLKAIWEEMEKSMTVLKELKRAAEETGLKLN